MDPKARSSPYIKTHNGYLKVLPRWQQPGSSPHNACHSNIGFWTGFHRNSSLTQTTMQPSWLSAPNLVLIMSSITIKNIPIPLLNRIRERAAAEHRSLNKEFVQLAEMALNDQRAGASLNEQISRQTAAWLRLAGSWTTDADAPDTVETIYQARTTGRAVAL